MKKFKFFINPNRNEKFVPACCGNERVQASRSATAAAFAYVGVKKDEVDHCDLVLENGMYEAVFSTDCLRYDIFVDGGSGEVVGCNFEPLSI